MRIKFGIMLKFLLWYLALIAISYATILFLFIHIHRLMQVSNTIVDKNYAVSSLSKRLIENLLSMEENEKKYSLLKKKEYKEYFASSRKEFEGNLLDILALEPLGQGAGVWNDLYRDYRSRFPSSGKPIEERVPGDNETGKHLWIPEEMINEWIQTISQARTENEQQVESEMLGLHRRGKMAVRWGVVGLGVSLLMGVLGSVFLTHSINRPLRELLRGIRSISRAGLSEPIRISSQDEFGELAGAFNEMTARLKEEEQMRSDFISMLSHEVRTPLTSIRESVNLIAEEVIGTINDRQRRFLEIASQELERISDLLKHLMQVSRMEGGALEIHSQSLDSSALVNNSVYRLAPVAESKNIRIRTEVPPDLPLLKGDGAHLRQVLLNLLGNAIKFSSPGGEVIVRVQPSEDHSSLIFSISDDGPGIVEEELPLVFHKYFRGSKMRDLVDGVGLGLSISKYIIEAHGGTIWVESQPGQGSIFRFSLPVGD